MSEGVTDKSQDVATGFAAMMSEAHGQAAAESPEAPYGYTTDEDGTRRPKKTLGRPRKSPSLEELKAEREAAAASAPAGSGPPPGDRAPAGGRMRRQKPTQGAKPEPGKPVVQFREGVIAKGMNKTYRKAGKMIRVADRDIGQAFIDITKKEDDDDVTVGEAWEELARANPRIRAFLMRMIAGGAAGQVFMCHAPILLAVLMKDRIRKHIPFMGLMEAFLTADTEDGGDGTAPAEGTPLEGLGLPDMNQMMKMAQQFAEQAMNAGRAAGGPPRPPVQGPAAITAGPAASAG